MRTIIVNRKGNQGHQENLNKKYLLESKSRRDKGKTHTRFPLCSYTKPCIVQLAIRLKTIQIFKVIRTQQLIKNCFQKQIHIW